MTRLLTCGWETSDINETGSAQNVGVSSTLAVVTSTPTPRAGTYVLKALINGNTPNQAYKSIVLPAPKTDVWVRFAFYLHVGGSSGPTQTFTFANWLDSGGGGQISLGYNANTGLLQVQGPSTQVSSMSMTLDTWHVIEWRQQMTSTTAGISELWLDGNQVVNFTGDNSGTTNLTVLTLQLGVQSGPSSSGSTYMAYDDLAINDTTASTPNNGRPGDGRVVLLAPSGAGSSTQFTRGGTDTGANWSQTSEIPPSMTQYVGSATVGQRDLYALTDLSAAVSSINVVEVLAYGQNADAGGGYLAPTVKSSSTTSEATPVGLATGPTYITGRWETDPATSAAWTQSGVNALEVGGTVR